jgi:erythronate-4-phosphate dehydrogenase
LACDIVSLHTPMTRTGSHPTYHLLNRERLERFKPHQILLNTGRGPVIDSEALLAVLQRMPELSVVLDVWETEPYVSAALLQHVVLGSAHIAGYSLDGKMRGTEMIYQALCRHLNRSTYLSLTSFLPEPLIKRIDLGAGADGDEAVLLAMRACYDPRTDDALLRQVVAHGDESHGAAFDGLRKSYRVRREFSGTQIGLNHDLHAPSQASLYATLRTLGFQCVADRG